MPITSTGPVTFGSAQIGNWKAKHRNLNGQLDEVVILGRALDADEVIRLATTSVM